MIARAGSGWQTVLADLSLILFMTTAAAVSEAPAAPPQAKIRLPALGEPVAVWRAAPDGPSLPEWLATQSNDPRQRLTLVAAPVDGSAAMALAATADRPVRVLIEPGLAAPPYAALTYDNGENP